jgi:hypothetical protein
MPLGNNRGAPSAEAVSQPNRPRTPRAGGARSLPRTWGRASLPAEPREITTLLADRCEPGPPHFGPNARQRTQRHPSPLGLRAAPDALSPQGPTPQTRAKQPKSALPNGSARPIRNFTPRQESSMAPHATQATHFDSRDHGTASQFRLASQFDKTS